MRLVLSDAQEGIDSLWNRGNATVLFVNNLLFPTLIVRVTGVVDYLPALHGLVLIPAAGKSIWLLSLCKMMAKQ